jgi:hypothetical protein
MQTIESLRGQVSALMERVEELESQRQDSQIQDSQIQDGGETVLDKRDSKAG